MTTIKAKVIVVVGYIVVVTIAFCITYVMTNGGATCGGL